jgi:hypothetical protein
VISTWYSINCFGDQDRRFHVQVADGNRGPQSFGYFYSLGFVGKQSHEWLSSGDAVADAHEHFQANAGVYPVRHFSTSAAHGNYCAAELLGINGHNETIVA